MESLEWLSSTIIVRTQKEKTLVREEYVAGHKLELVANDWSA